MIITKVLDENAFRDRIYICTSFICLLVGREFVVRLNCDRQHFSPFHSFCYCLKLGEKLDLLEKYAGFVMHADCPAFDAYRWSFNQLERISHRVKIISKLFLSKKHSTFTLRKFKLSIICYNLYQCISHSSRENVIEINKINGTTFFVGN